MKKLFQKIGLGIIALVDTTVNPPILGPNDKGGTIHYNYINENEYAILNY